MSFNIYFNLGAEAPKIDGRSYAYSTYESSNGFVFHHDNARGFYLDDCGDNPLRARVPKSLMDKVYKVVYKQDQITWPALRRYGFYRLQSATLDNSLVHGKHDRRYSVELVADNLEDAIALYTRFMEGTIFPEVDYEAAQEGSQQALVKQLKAKRSTKESNESIHARLLKCQDLFSKERILDQAEEAYENDDEALCDRLLTQLGFQLLYLFLSATRLNVALFYYDFSGQGSTSTKSLVEVEP